MKLIIKEFLTQLRESGELDRLLPDLLARMKIIPISRPQVGVRQNGVDIAAVGKDPESGVKTLFLFVLKVGDIGRRSWDEGVNAIRPTLNQIKDSYLRTYVRSEHQHLPVKIVIVTTGDLKQEVQSDYSGYTAAESAGRLNYELWTGDKLADLVGTHLLDEYAMSPDERSDLRRAISLIGTKDYDLRHVNKLFDQLLIRDLPSERPLTSPERKKLSRNLKTVALVLEILFRWGAEEGNLLNVFKAGERCVLLGWEALRARSLLSHKPLASALVDVLNIHERIAHAYFMKFQHYFYVQDGMSVHAGDAALVANKVFEQVGVVAEVGLLQLMKGQDALPNADAVAHGLAALIHNNPASASPRFDGHAIEISMALLLLVNTGNTEAARRWLTELVRRLVWTYTRSKGFPIATDSIDDLAEFEVGELEEEEVAKLRNLSTLIPGVAYWCALLEMHEEYKTLQSAQEKAFEGVCLQLWYPDDDTENFIYRQPAQLESGTTEAPIVLPPTAAELLTAARLMQREAVVAQLHTLSAVSHGLFALVLVACRHFRTPVPPQFMFPSVEAGESASESAAP